MVKFNIRSVVAVQSFWLYLNRPSTSEEETNSATFDLRVAAGGELLKKRCNAYANQLMVVDHQNADGRRITAHEIVSPLLLNTRKRPPT
jgi:hypothetical protein